MGVTLGKYQYTGKRLAVKIPLRVELKRKRALNRVVPLSLNTFRGLHPRVIKEVKEVLEGMIEGQIPENFQFQHPVEVTFQIVRNTNRRSDKSNWYSQITKLTYDSIKDIGAFIDDNDKYIYDEIIKTPMHSTTEEFAYITFREVEAVEKELFIDATQLKI